MKHNRVEHRRRQTRRFVFKHLENFLELFLLRHGVYKTENEQNDEFWKPAFLLALSNALWSLRLSSLLQVLRYTFYNRWRCEDWIESFLSKRQQRRSIIYLTNSIYILGALKAAAWALCCFCFMLLGCGLRSSPDTCSAFSQSWWHIVIYVIYSEFSSFSASRGGSFSGPYSIMPESKPSWSPTNF